jgi:hypothetical protein
MSSRTHGVQKHRLNLFLDFLSTLLFALSYFYGQFVYKNVVDTTEQRMPINLLSDHHPVPKNYASATPLSTTASSSYTALNCAGSRHASCTTHGCHGVHIIVVAVSIVADTLVVSSLSHLWWCSRCHCCNHGHSRGSTANCKCHPFPPLRSC